MIHGTTAMESETIDLKPLMPVVNAYLGLLNEGERKELYKEARAKINDEDFLKRLEEKGEDEKSILLHLISSYAPETKANKICEQTAKYLQDNRNDLIEIIDEKTKEDSALEAFMYVTGLAIMSVMTELIYQEVQDIHKTLKRELKS